MSNAVTAGAMMDRLREFLQARQHRSDKVERVKGGLQLKCSSNAQSYYTLPLGVIDILERGGWKHQHMDEDNWFLFPE